MNDEEHQKIFFQLQGNDVDLKRNKAYISTILSPSDTGAIKKYFDKFDLIKSKQLQSVDIVKNIQKSFDNNEINSLKTGFKFDFNRLNVFPQNKGDQYMDCICKEITENEIKAIDNEINEFAKIDSSSRIGKNQKDDVKESVQNELKNYFDIEKHQKLNDKETKNAPGTSRLVNVMQKQTKFQFNKNENLEANNNKYPSFVASKQKYIEDMKTKGLTPNFNTGKKTLGGKVAISSKFNPPWSNENNYGNQKSNSSVANDHEKLRNIDPDMIERINSEILEIFQPVDWNDIAGLEYVKSTVKEAVVLPMLRPDLFTGLRKPPRGILLFGPPGTGKTLIGKCIASQSKSTFFSISASSLTSKWIGDGEKMIRTLFAVAAARSPSVIFIDEIDSLLCQRSESEHESSRRMKTEFLVQLDGAGTSDEERILIVGATNRPQELDEAARRRLVRRLYIPLPEIEARIQILQNLCKTVKNTLTNENFLEIANMSEGFSGADMKTLCSDASMEPLRSIPFEEIENFDERNLRPLSYSDFQNVLRKIRPSVSSNDLQQYIQWDKTYGSGNR